jgi:hypothetical protein
MAAVAIDAHEGPQWGRERDRRRAAYDVWPVTAATMIRGNAWTSAAVHGFRDHRSEFPFAVGTASSST